MKATSLLRFAATLVAAGTLGCPGEIDDPTPFLTAGSCPNVETETFPTRCGQSGCHNADDMMGMLDLVSPDLPSRIVGVDGSTDCHGQVLADPNDAQGSLLYQKLTNAPPCGAQMPFAGGTKFNAGELECVANYIEGLSSGSGGGGGMGGGGMGGGGMGGAAGAGGT